MVEKFPELTNHTDVYPRNPRRLLFSVPITKYSGWGHNSGGSRYQCQSSSGEALRVAEVCAKVCVGGTEGSHGPFQSHILKLP